MGSIGGLLGTSGGASGTGYSAPQQASITPGTNATNIAQANTGVQNSLGSQQALLQALQTQGGTGIQSSAANQMQGLAGQQAGVNSVGAQQQALQSQQGFNSQLAGVGGVQNQQSALQAQQALAQQYQGIANGTGPNPAMAALNQQTGANVANQAALMAGQRGANANVGLIARQAAQQGAATQQQSVGQGATLQANQSLNALSGIGAAQQSVANTAAQQVGQQQTGVNAAQSAASGITSQQQAQQQALAGVGSTIAGQQIGATSANTQAQLSAQQIQQQALAAQNQASVASQGSVNAGNTTLAGTTIQGQQGVIGGTANAIGGVLNSVLAEGGDVERPKKFADGGGTPTAIPTPTPQADPTGPQSEWGQFLQNLKNQSQDPSKPFNMASSSGAQALQSGIGSIGKPLGNAIKGWMQPEDELEDDPEQTYAGPDSSDIAGDDTMAAKGGMPRKDFTSGGNVKADVQKEKAVKKGNSYDNDKIPALLSEHEIVIPRSITQSKDPVGGAAEFVRQVMAKRGRR